MKTFFLAMLLACAYPSVASVSFSNLTTNGSVGLPCTGAVCTTASVTCASNAPVFLTTSGRLFSGNGPGPVVSVAGCGMTWTLITGSNATPATLDAGPSEGTARADRLEIWCGSSSSGSTGTIAITWSAAPSNTTWTVSQSSGAATTCAGILGDVFTHGTVNTATASPLSVTMSSFNSTSSGTYAGGFCEGSRTMNAGTSMTLLGTTPNANNSTADEFAATNITPATITYTSTNVVWGVIGVEVQVQALSSKRPLSF